MDVNRQTGGFGSPLKFPRHMGIIFTGLVFTLALSLPLHGKTNKRDQKSSTLISEEVMDLMSDDPYLQLQGIDVLRQTPNTARNSLIFALRQKNRPPGWWRAVHRLTKYGKSYDIPFLLALRWRTRDPWERHVIEGTIESLYEVPEDTQPLVGVVRGLSFSNSRNPSIIKDPRKGTWMLTDWSFEALHRSGFPSGLMRKLEDFKGVPHKDEDELKKALSKKLGQRIWQIYQEQLSAVADRVPTRVILKGKVQIALRNPLNRPLLLTASLDLFFGNFRRDITPALVYLRPKQSTSLTFPVTVEGTSERNHIHLHARIAEINGPPVTTFRSIRVRFRTK